MERRTLEAFVWGLPLINEARADAVARGLRQFEDQDPTLEQLHSWGASLRESAPHFFAPPPAQPQEHPAHELIPNWLPPGERLARARQMGLTVPGKVKPATPLVLTPTQHAELAKLDPVARLQRYREWQAEAQTGQR